MSLFEKGYANSNSSRACFVLALLCILVFSIYSSSFHAAWHFDDKPNIVNNTALHIRNLQPDTLIGTLFTKPSDPWHAGVKLYRPVACLTFALNWYLGKDNVFGYHLVNIAIHVLNAFLLYLVIAGLLRAPALGKRYDRQAVQFIALLAAALWAANPIQTQAVTYIVQRMASMAALFYLLGMYCYLKARLNSKGLQRVICFFCCGLSFLCALGSKQNAVMLPAALLLVEFIFIQKAGSQGTKNIKRGVLLLGGIFLLAALIAIVMGKGRDLFLANGYQTRPFTLGERLLTEPRIALYYLSQIFYPLPSRLSIEHDVILSTSLAHPWTTLPAILLIGGLVGGAFLRIRRWPLLAFAMLFFFLNHIVESSFIALELVFEHRNYLPSLFLFLPIAAGLKYGIDYYRLHNRYLYIGIAMLIPFMMMALGAGTYNRNLAWATEASLWQDAMKKAPASARPLTNIAWEVTHRAGVKPNGYPLALALYKRSLSLRQTKTTLRPAILNNMAGIYMKMGEIKKAFTLLETALKIDPNYNKGRYGITRILMLQRRWDLASRQADILLDKDPNHEGYLNLKGLILLKQNKCEEALRYFRRSLKQAPNFKLTLTYMGIAFGLCGAYERSEWFLLRAQKTPPSGMMPLLGLIQTSKWARDNQKAVKYARTLIAMYNFSDVKNRMQRFSTGSLFPPLSASLISPVIAAALQIQYEQLSGNRG